MIFIMPLLKYFDLSLQCFYISLIKIVLASCHLKNYFVITYLLEDEQELSLGMLIRCKRIYNFWCSMLVFYPMPHVFYAFTFVFRLISCTNLLTRCPRPVAVFCCFSISEKFWRKYSRKGLKIHGDQFLPGTKTDTEGDPEGGQGASSRPPGAGPP